MVLKEKKEEVWPSLMTKSPSSTEKSKYTWAPQTLHNTPVVNILKGYFCIILLSNVNKTQETNMKF